MCKDFYHLEIRATKGIDTGNAFWENKTTTVSAYAFIGVCNALGKIPEFGLVKGLNTFLKGFNLSILYFRPFSNYWFCKFLRGEALGISIPLYI
jgi:hypothetical protein